MCQTIINDIVDWSTISAAIISFIGLIAILFQFRHLRGANFISAWNIIESKLQSEDNSIGRKICEYLNKDNNSHNLNCKFYSSKDWKTKFKEMKDEVFQKKIAEKLSKLKRKDLALELEKYIKNAFDTFDLVSILAWHSHIPGLWDTVVAEWQDGIINTWEFGIPILLKRKKQKRVELYECFSTLYHSALKHNKTSRGYYPFRGLFKKTFSLLWLNSRLLNSIKAKKERENYFKECNKKK